uniref:Uncharacterized protein n=1 Tax=Anolis carolinensis TaxID=28377 RepID=A0A803TDS6_ANOCA
MAFSRLRGGATLLAGGEGATSEGGKTEREGRGGRRKGRSLNGEPRLLCRRLSIPLLSSRRSERCGSGAMAAFLGGGGGERGGGGGSLGGGGGLCPWPRSPPGSALGWEPLLPGLQIRSRSVEQTLVPLVAQITTLINHKDKPKRSDKTLRAVQQVGQAVNLAVGRFVMVGEAIASENQELKEEMKIACTEAKQAGETIAQLTDIAVLDHPESDGQITIFTDKTDVVKAARLLLSSVTKVLVLADRIVVKQIINSRNKVCIVFINTVNTFFN